MISTNAGYGGDCPVRPRSPAGECVREGWRVPGGWRRGRALHVEESPSIQDDPGACGLVASEELCEGGQKLSYLGHPEYISEERVMGFIY
jgi:hypothetical protein